MQHTVKTRSQAYRAQTISDIVQKYSEDVKSNDKFFETDLQIFQMITKYARYLDEEKRRETWPEIVNRAITFLRTRPQLAAVSQSVWDELTKGLLYLEAAPSMRLIQMAGPAAERCNVSIYNCAYSAANYFRFGKTDDGRVENVFAETLYILMQGTGCSFGVENIDISKLPVVENIDISKLPVVQLANGVKKPTHVVEDSTEGWCEALRLGTEAWYSGYDIEFDVSKIRPAGARLKTKGGRASGPKPLIKLLGFTREVMMNAQGRKLKDIEVHDILCMVGQIVQVGGVRRAAMLSLSDLNSKDMREAKNGKFWETHPWRTMANNSSAYNRKPSREEFLEEWQNLAASGTGERGIFNRASSIFSTLAPRRKADRFGTNPCGEINLRSREFCNLSISIIRPEDNLEDIKRKVRLATIFGTMQSALTDFNYISDQWKKNCDEERLLGVDITGICDNPLLRPAKTDETEHRKRRCEILRELRDCAIEVNKEFADIIGIPQSVAVTCNKPSGNSSVLFNTSPGQHARYAKYQIRRVRVGATDPVCALLKKAGVPHAPEYNQDPENPETWVFDFPLAAPEGALVKDDLNILEQLEGWKDLKLNWTEHNPSATIYVGKDEWDIAGDWVYENWEYVGGLSFLPRSDAVYALLPNEEITEEQYNELAENFPQIPWEELILYEDDDYTTSAQEYACTSGQCEVI